MFTSKKFDFISVNQFLLFLILDVPVGDGKPFLLELRTGWTLFFIDRFRSTSPH
jgi:hypothetical protein